MLARKDLPSKFREWNARWGAPFGARLTKYVPLRTRYNPVVGRILGPFAYQPNSRTRMVEYPWAFCCAGIQRGMSVLEVGGALSGFQFVLARHGARVTNVDPFVDYGGQCRYPGGPVALHQRLNRTFGTEVTLIPSTLPRAGLGEATFDRAYCISTIEHLSRSDLAVTLQEIRRVLKPGGLLIVTTDLFLNLAPFTKRSKNRYGANISIRAIVEESGMRLVSGDMKELCGFPEFETERVLSTLEEYSIGDYPALAQLFVLQK